MGDAMTELIKVSDELTITLNEIEVEDEPADPSSYIAGLCPNCLEVVCECPKPVRPRKKVKTDNFIRPVTPATRSRRSGAGRSPAGRIRNFGAMGDDKLVAVYKAMVRERTLDHEAMKRIEAELEARGIE